MDNAEEGYDNFEIYSDIVNDRSLSKEDKEEGKEFLQDHFENLSGVITRNHETVIQTHALFKTVE